MKYTLTSAEANKLLRKIAEEKSLCLDEERKSNVFCAAMGEEIESVRPAYDYAATQKIISACDEKTGLLKHAINCFNASTVVPETGMTIDRLLIYLPQLNERRNRLYSMQNRLPKQRSSVAGIGSNTVIDYMYANYDVEQAKADYLAVSDEIRRLQTALDTVNTTITFEVELPE